MEKSETINMWCLIELFGHQKIAGHVTEQNIAGVNMLRVQVPATETTPEFTKFYGGAAIYAINPIDEVSAIALVNQLKVSPVVPWSIQSYLDKQPKELLPEITSAGPNENEPVDFDEDDLPW